VTHRIRVEADSLRFAAGHFATFEGDCEALHGHNYRVVVEVAGDLTGDSWVADFRQVKKIAAGICDELDHGFLLQTAGRELVIEETESEYTVNYGSRRYVIPREDVVPLPIDNTTAERLAEWLAGGVAAGLAKSGASNIDSITVGVEEAPGQSGWFTLSLS
jgi:6-pyruvoyl tetrahydropterin synthase/QueD family protein